MDVVVLSITTFVGKAPARYAHVLALSSFAKHHSVHLVPVAAQEFISAAASNSSAVHKLERAKHIPVLCQQVLIKACRSCLRCSYVIARLRMYLSTRQENPAETAVLMNSAANGSQTPHLRSIEINTSASSALEEAYEHKTTRTPKR